MATVPGVASPLITVENRSQEPVRLPLLAMSLPRWFSGTVDDPAVPYLVELTLTYDGDRVACEQLTCRRRDGGPAVTSEGMTRVRVADLVSRMALEEIREQSTFVPGKDQPAVVVRHDVEIPPRPHGRRGPTTEHLRVLSAIYTVAHACGGSPRRSVMDKLMLTRTTANRWIRLAREQGHLPPRGDDQEGE